ncbi:MAG TPA: ABC transporter permease [Vicinamibacteria bacterium]|jgi:putative ABC transport system permease protein|nr:ABC transporter permease [Vicinamibacteria bacterium]
MVSRAEVLMVWKLFRADAAHNRKRITLTVLAIAWGTLSIVLLLSFGEGLKRAFHRGKLGMGEGIGVVWPGATTRAYRGLPSGRTVSFTDEDAELLKARIPELQSLSREYSRRRGLTVGTKTVNARIRGVDPSFGEMRNQVPQAGGRFIDEPDLAEKRRVVFLGDELAQDLFGTQDVVGKTVLINQSSFLVVGVMQKKIMMGMYSGPDKGQATMPASTFKATYSDATVGNLVYKPLRPDLGDQAKAEIYRILGGKHQFDPDDTRSLGIWDTREDQRLTTNIAVGIQMFLGVIGALTLGVGGMGVANIMYAVVKERTREIGVKMALGAKSRQVMAPFVLEALLMTVLGGFMGTLVSLGLMAGIAAIPLKGEAFEFLGRPTFSPAIAVATSTILGTIGMLAGYFPARRAAAVNPAVSLRYE